MSHPSFTTNPEGFLEDSSSWNKDFALLTAQDEQIKMSDIHWEVVNYLREYYQEHQKSPAIRELVKALKIKFGPEVGNSLYLQSLFPESPAVQAAKIAGLPKPKKCI
tara:strand:+ start:279 stop:599 length:321 start_codon:yes stop_codon:yes gene_type:complete